MLQSKSQNYIRKTTKYFEEIITKFVTYCDQQEQTADDLIDQLDPENYLVIERSAFLQKIQSLGISFDENDLNEIFMVLGISGSKRINLNQFYDEVSRMAYIITEKKYKTTYF